MELDFSNFKDLDSLGVEELRDKYRELRKIKNQLDRLSLMNLTEGNETYTDFAKREFLNIQSEFNRVLPYTLCHVDLNPLQSKISSAFINVSCTYRKDSVRGKIRLVSSCIESICFLIVKIGKSKI